MKQALFDSHLHCDCFINKIFFRQIDRSRVIPAEKSKISKNQKDKWRNSVS